MAFDGTSGNCWAPTWPVQVNREPRLHVAKFGDGYEQRTLDGINSMSTTWSLKWDMRPRAIAQAMDAYLVGLAGAAFNFLDPQTETVVKVFCDKWQLDWEYQGKKDEYATVTAEFRTANGVAA
jgi:phage-related protein